MTRAVLLVMALACASCGAPWGQSPEPLAVGDTAPAAWSTGNADGALLVVWALRGADMVTCATAAREIRHVQRAHPGKVRAMAVVAGRDSALVASFLRAERLAALSRRYLSEREMRSQTGGETAQTLYVVQDGVVVARLRADRQTLLSGRGADRLEMIVTALLAQAA